MFAIIIDAGDIGWQSVVGTSKNSRHDGGRPGLCQDFGILHCSFILKSVALARQALDHMRDIAMQRPISAKPGFIVQASHVHYQRFSLPVTYGVAHGRRIQSRAMRSTICGNHTKRAVGVSACCTLPVQKHYLLPWSLNNLIGRSYTWDPGILTREGRRVVV